MASAGHSSDPTAGLDMSQVRPPAKLAISGIEQVMDVLLYGTLEVKQYLAAECDLIFECRICRALFRSLPNFIGHKRMFCTEKMTIQMLIDEPEKSDEADSTEEVNKTTKDRGTERSVSIGSGKGSQSDDRHMAKQESPGSLSGPSTSERAAEKVSSAKKQKSSCSAARSTKTVQQSTAVDPNIANLEGKLTYADIVDFVKKTCKLCGMKAPERRHLVEHARNTHADRLYFLQCPHCPCSFFITGNLTRHLKNAHNVDAKAADVTVVLPGMNTHAMSLMSLQNQAKSKQARPQSQQSQMQHRRSSQIRTTFTRSSRKRTAQDSSNAASTSTASDNSPATSGNSVRKVPQRKLPVDTSADVSFNQSLASEKASQPAKTLASKAATVKPESNPVTEDEDDEDALSLAAMANRSTNVQTNGLDEDTTLVVSASKVPESESKSAAPHSRPIVLRSRPSRSTVSKNSNNKTESAAPSSPQVAPPAPKLARLEVSQSQVTSPNNNGDAHLRSALTLANAGSAIPRSLRKGGSVASSSLGSGSRSAVKVSSDSHSVESSSSSSLRSTRRLSLAANPVSSPSSTEVLDFHCRRCHFSSVTLAECASHVQTEHGVKVDRRDPQPHIEVSRQAISTGADQTTGVNNSQLEAKVAAS